MPFVPTNPLPANIDTAAEVYTALSNATPDPNFEYWVYDEFNRMERHTDYKKQDVGYFYNYLGQLQYKKYYEFADVSPADGENDNYPGSPIDTIEYTYDKLGRKNIVEVNNVTVQDFDYDSEGRVYTIDTPQGEIGYGYNSITGRKDTILTPDTDVWVNVDTLFDYTYDELGRLKEVSVSKRNTVDLTDNSPAGEEERIIYEYNPVGSIDTITRRVNGTDILITEYSYDEMNRLESVTNKDSSLTTLSSFTYTVYADGQKKSVTELDGTIIDWTYDNLNRLETEDYNAPGTSNDYVHDYYYDLVGNRTQFDVDSTPQVYYFYSENDRLEKETSDSGGNNNLVSYLYDDNGSLTQADNGTVTTYTYNLQNRLDSVTEGANPTVTYKYNPDGIRVQKKVGTAEPINYLIDPYNHTGYAQVLKETQTGSDDIVFIIGHDVMAQATGTSSSVFMVYDGHGSVRQLADNTGSVISGQNFNYDSYGNILGSPTPQTDYLYAGEQYDPSLDWYYNRARYYNPSNSRFNRVDPFAGFIYEPQSLHKYLYVHCDPINGTDPSGQFFLISMASVQNISAKIRTKTAATGVAAHEFARKIASQGQYYYYRLAFEMHRLQGFLTGRIWSHSLRSNLKSITGDMPGMHAHHVLPKAFETWFNSRGIHNIHEPIYGMWIEPSWHLSKSRAYNEAWQAFRHANPEANVQQILDFAKEISAEIMQSPTFIP